MKKYSNHILSAFMSAIFAFSSLFLLNENSFAAQSEKSGSISKGTTAVIMIAIFIITAACTAFITFKVRKKKTSYPTEASSDKEHEE
ncbi:hypothetical protein [Ruminococcus sp.]|uniref:hypothetical protein n=1 Tax=Ruminococcus sp. TaxID=41978 RepID=UPI002C170AF3|nr:hypothetical protein [Ruminococcus sp.]HNZ98327.1 hypothetical protein [Ruminococcus sp.]HOH88385.1 hypothetical protein [Ruminococcus sp.]